MEISKKGAMSLILSLFSIFWLGIWTIDISVSAMLVSLRTGQEAVTTNGFWVRNPIQEYHLGLCLVIISVFSLTLLLTHLLIETPLKSKK